MSVKTRCLHLLAFIVPCALGGQAYAMAGPEVIEIDGGPLGDLEISGGIDGYGYFMSNTTNSTSSSSGIQSDGINLNSALLKIQKTKGIVQFTLEIGASSFQVLGQEAYETNGHIAQASVQKYPTGPIYQGYLTIAPPNTPFTISAGMLPCLEGYEYGMAYYNAVQLLTLLYYAENNNARGAEVSFNKGPFSATVQFGDSTDSGVWNTIQALLTYNFNANNSLNVYGADNLGKTGPFTTLYGLPHVTKTGLNDAYANNALIGAYYIYTHGNWNLVPEVQYVYARKDAQIGIMGQSSNFGAALFSDYSFTGTPYSIGSWVEYFDSHSSATSNYDWAIGPNAEAVGLAVAPTWQYKRLYTRLNAGYIYLLHNRDALGNSYGFGDNKSHGQFTGTLEAGLMF
jgi:hypothetical protein